MYYGTVKFSKEIAKDLKDRYGLCCTRQLVKDLQKLVGRNFQWPEEDFSEVDDELKDWAKDMGLPVAEEEEEDVDTETVSEGDEDDEDGETIPVDKKPAPKATRAKGPELPANQAKEMEEALPSKDVEVAWTALAYARFIGQRLGLEGCRVNTPERGRGRGQNVSATLLCGDALTKKPYDILKVQDPSPQFLPPRFELVFVDPPFGLNKHREDDDLHWDEEPWDASHIVRLLSTLKDSHVLREDHYNVAVYCRQEMIGDLVKAFTEWIEIGGDPLKGHISYTLVNSGYAPLLKGISSPGHRCHVLVAKFIDGHSIMFDGNGLGGGTELSFPRPVTRSRYGRSDIDAAVIDEGGKGLGGGKAQWINATQKSVEECRCLVRHLTPQQGLVLSVCNGTGTAMIAAALEGRSSVGVDKSLLQCTWARRRLQTFFHRENLLVRYLNADVPSTASLLADLNKATLGRGLEDPQVRCGGHSLLAIMCKWSDTAPRATQHVCVFEHFASLLCR